MAMANACDSRSKIETLVIFDIEATGLPSLTSPPKIAEFSMVAVNRNELLSPNGKPRVINKLKICVNPVKPIPQIVSQMTGLFNDHLENQTIFNTEIVCIINGFLNRLPKPVCLISHNGHGYDFPLLKAEIEGVGGVLSDHVTCSDSLIAFRDLAGEEPWEGHKPYLLNSKYETRSSDPCAGNILSNPNSMQESINHSSNGVQRSPLDLSQGLNPLNLSENNDQVSLIDENMNVSSNIQPNQNLHMNNNNEQMVDLEIQNSTPPENGVLLPEEDIEDEEDFNSPPRHQQMLVRHGSSDFDEDDLSMDSMNFKFVNENTPSKRPDTETWAPRKNNPPKERIEPGKTRRQLNFENDESSEPKAFETPNKLQSIPDAQLGKTKRRLNFGAPESTVHSNFDSGESCRKFKKINDCESGAKAAFLGEASQRQTVFTPPLHVDTDCGDQGVIAPSSLSDEDFRCAVESMERSFDETPRRPSKTISHTRQEETSKLSADVEPCKTTSQPSASKPTKRLSYGLVNLYTRVFGHCPNVSHTSEDDCITLLALIQKHSPHFLYWIDSHHITFKDVKPMY